MVRNARKSVKHHKNSKDRQVIAQSDLWQFLEQCPKFKYDH